MPIHKHQHMWVPWNEKRMNVCDEPGCTAAVPWGPKVGGQALIIDWAKPKVSTGNRKRNRGSKR